MVAPWSLVLLRGGHGGLLLLPRVPPGLLRVWVRAVLPVKHATLQWSSRETGVTGTYAISSVEWHTRPDAGTRGRGDGETGLRCILFLSPRTTMERAKVTTNPAPATAPPM